MVIGFTQKTIVFAFVFVLIALSLLLFFIITKQGTRSLASFTWALIGRKTDLFMQHYSMKNQSRITNSTTVSIVIVS